MPQVFLDGETVNFEGPKPQNPFELRKILSDHLLNNGLVLISFKVDGKETLELPEDKQPDNYSTIEASSASQGIAIAQIVDEVLQEQGTLPTQIHHLSNTLLIYPWEESKPKITHLIEHLCPILEVMTYIIGFGSSQAKDSIWYKNCQNNFNSFQKHLVTLANYIEHEDIGGISELLNLHITSLVEDSFQCMAECVQDTFPSDKNLENN